jgi:hypothetical protein
MTIINLTQHLATAEQAEAGVIDLPNEYRDQLVDLLTFNSLEEANDALSRAEEIEDLVIDYLKERVFVEEINELDDELDGLEIEDLWGLLRKKNIRVMIGGAPFLMPKLEEVLGHWAKVGYAFSTRESVETVVDGKTIKQSVFAHKGFVWAN